MFDFLKRKPKCQHEWHYISRDFTILAEPRINIYCPKCSKRTRVTEDTWKALQIQMKYDAEHPRDIHDLIKRR